MKRIVYFIMKYITRISVYTFFNKVEIVGVDKIPRNKPIIFAPNHQNAFLDAFVVGSLSPIGIHYLTRADVFNNPFRWFMDAFQMMPIYRKRDGFGKLSQNAGVFEACRKLFSQDKSVLIFPEGSHGEDYFLRPLTKGISRLALESQDIIDDREVWVQPVGLNYFDLRKPRRKAIIVFGEPIKIQDYLEEYKIQKVKALVSLREKVYSNMRDCMIIPDQDEFYEAKVKTLTPDNERLSFDQLKKVLAATKEPPIKRKPMPIFGQVGKFLGIINYPPLFVINNLLQNKIKDIVFTSSIKWAIGLLLFPLWWMLMFTAIAIFSGMKWAFIVVASAIVVLFLRQELQKLSN